jgi:uncharacterized DUF497 family protein
VSAHFDPKRNAANSKRHGASLSADDGVVNDPLALTVEDDAAGGAQRFVTMGANVFGALMVVVHAPRRGGSRVIWVRKADPKERRDDDKGVWLFQG